MEHLEAEVQHLLRASLAEGTQRVYKRGVESFDTFRRDNGMFVLWPAPQQHVVAFIAALSLEKKAPATIKSYIAGIAFQHNINGWDDPSKHFIVQKLLLGSKKSAGKPDARAPITLPLLLDLIRVLDLVCSSSYESCLFKAAFLMAFFAFLRVGEFTTKSKKDRGEKVLSIGDVSFPKSDCSVVQLCLRFSKTDQLGRSSTVVLHQHAGSPLCPVAALRVFLAARPHGVRRNPLFIHFDGSPLTRFQFDSMLKKSLSCSGYVVDRFKSHSFRIGAATTAAMCGLGSAEIQRMGRWQSGAFKLYIRPHDIAKSQSCSGSDFS